MLGVHSGNVVFGFLVIALFGWGMIGCSNQDDNDASTVEEISQRPFHTTRNRGEGDLSVEMLVRPAQEGGVLQVGKIRIFVDGMKFSGAHKTQVDPGVWPELKEPFETVGGPLGGQLHIFFEKEGVRGRFGPFSFRLYDWGITINKRQIEFEGSRKNVWVAKDGQVSKIEVFDIESSALSE